MSRELVPIWLVWEFRNKDQMAQLRAIDTREDFAKGHKKALQSEAECFGRKSMVWIERTFLDHLFGWESLQSLLRGKGQQDYADELKKSGAVSK